MGRRALPLLILLFRSNQSSFEAKRFLPVFNVGLEMGD